MRRGGRGPAAIPSPNSNEGLIMRHLNPSKAALSVGIVLGLWHLAWVTMVALGVAKPVLDYIQPELVLRASTNR